jgi:glycosyltransferase involved in cell wall biosynthesis
LKVLVQSRRDVGTILGGDLTALKLKQPYLEDMGVTFDHSVESDVDLDPYDLVYLTTITRVHETHAQMLNAQASGVPTVTRPLYNSRADLDDYLRRGQTRAIRSAYSILGSFERYQKARTMYYAARNGHIGEGLRQVRRGYHQQQRDVVLGSFMTPDSQMEMDDIQMELGVQSPAHLVVPNSLEVSGEAESADSDLFFKKFGLRDIVLFPGRIEPLKNQVGLIRALSTLDVPVVFVGGVHGSHTSYFAEFQELVEAHSNCHYLGFVDRALLYSALRSAQVVVMPSWTENSGHGALEGGLMGANVVSTNRGYGRWYLRDDAWYCDPGDSASIRSAVESALDAPRGARPLRDRLLREFSPEATAQTLHRAFSLALENHHSV